MRVPLAAVANDRDRLFFKEADVAVLFVITLCHFFELTPFIYFTDLVLVHSPLEALCAVKHLFRLQDLS